MSALKRFFVPAVSEETILEAEEFEHAKNVLRLGVGDEAILLDNSGKEYEAVVASCEKRGMKLHVLRENEGDREATNEVALLFGYLKNADKNEFIVQKAVELGVKKIVAFSSAYSSAYMNPNKLERLNKVAREAAKQCLRSVAPEVMYKENLKDALLFADGFSNKIFACEFAQESGADVAAIRGSTALVVGSEGGFSREEEALAKELGFVSVTLGKRILRAETAAVALTAIVMFSLGELGARPGGTGKNPENAGKDREKKDGSRRERNFGEKAGNGTIENFGGNSGNNRGRNFGEKSWESGRFHIGEKAGEKAGRNSLENTGVCAREYRTRRAGENAGDAGESLGRAVEENFMKDPGESVGKNSGVKKV